MISIIEGMISRQSRRRRENEIARRDKGLEILHFVFGLQCERVNNPQPAWDSYPLETSRIRTLVSVYFRDLRAEADALASNLTGLEATWNDPRQRKSYCEFHHHFMVAANSLRAKIEDRIRMRPSFLQGFFSGLRDSWQTQTS